MVSSDFFVFEYAIYIVIFTDLLMDYKYIWDIGGITTNEPVNLILSFFVHYTNRNNEYIVIHHSSQTKKFNLT